MRLMKKEIQSLVPILLYFGSMILLIEWIMPLEQVTDTGETQAFILYIVLCFILTASFLPGWISAPLKFLGMLFIIDLLFIDELFLTKSWFSSLIEDLSINMTALLSQQWFELTPLFRTLLFLILLWMMSYLLYYWFVVRKKPLTFILVTFIYLTVLDTFTVFDASTAIVRAFIVSVVILGTAHFHRILENEGIQLPSFKRLTKWVVPLMVVIMFSTVIGYLAPKYDPIWPDPVPFLQAAASDGIGNGRGVGTRGPQRIGYDSNDERLGGGFVWDESTVFYAQSPNSQYWKVETKDVYTGKGWIRGEEGESIFSPEGDASQLMDYGEIVERRVGTTSINFVEPGKLDKVPYIYGTERFIPANNLQYRYNPTTGEVETVVNEEIVPLLADSNIFYDSEVERPFFPTSKMREVTEDSEPSLEPYLQLPETLPDRVIELAQEIVADADNRYDKALAIEQYFSRAGFQYEVEDVPVPGEEEDYVDQFLFETQRGYCDNFSTSMVVMLRAVDVPARWVKGFTGGERIYNQDVFEGSQPTYEIKNSNAHSWVEVYFPNVGWVPFEPTVGFDNETSFVLGEDIEDILERNRDRTPEERETPDIQEDEVESNEEEDEVAGAGTKGNTFTFYTGVIVLAVIALLVWFIIRKRYLILSKWKRQRFVKNTDINTFSDAYQFLLKVLSNKGLPFKEGQTLREYAKSVDSFYGNSDMTRLTNYYERAIYREEELTSVHEEVFRVWNKMVNKLIS